MVEAHNLYVELADGTMLKVDRIQNDAVLHVAVATERHYRDVLERFPAELRDNIVVTLAGAGEQISIEPRRSFASASTVDALTNAVHEQHAELESLRAVAKQSQDAAIDLNEKLESALSLIEELKATPAPTPVEHEPAVEPTTLEERAAKRREDTAPRPAKPVLPPPPSSQPLTVEDPAMRMNIPKEILADNNSNFVPERPRPSPPAPAAPPRPSRPTAPTTPRPT